ncbi:MAG: hypothetical protein ACI4J7_09030 [Ruminiclostridium sp.]
MDFKRKQSLCSAVFYISFVALVGVDSDNIMFFIIKNAVCIVAMAVSGIVGRLNEMSSDT